MKFRCTARSKSCKCQFSKWFSVKEMKRKSCPITGTKFAVETSADKNLGYPVMYYMKGKLF